MTESNFRTEDAAVKSQPARLLRNSARCRACGTEVESKHRHDFARCPCGAIAVDGGREYQRWVGDLDKFEDTSRWKEATK